MKKSLLFFILTIIWLSSCVTVREDSNGSKDPLKNSDTQLSAAIEEMYMLMDDLYSPGTRSMGNKAIASISPVSRPATRSASGDGEPDVFVVNFEDDGGYAILSTNDELDGVIALAECGSFDAELLLQVMTDIEAGLYDEGEETSTRSIIEDDDDPPNDPEDWSYGDEQSASVFDRPPFGTTTINTGGTNQPSYVNTTNNPVYALVGNYIMHPIGVTDPVVDDGDTGGYVTTPVWGPWVSEGGVAPLLATKWDQDDPYNLKCFTKSGKKAKVGCVAIAIGQIAANLQSPNNWNWSVISRFGVYNGAGVDEDSPNGRELTSSFLSSVGKGVNMDYGVKESGATLGAAKRYIKNTLKYKNVAKHDYSASRVKGRLDKQIPVYMRGRVTTYNGGHAWVIDGYMIRKREDQGRGKNPAQTQTLVHCNFGWGGLSDGYYVSGVFDLRKGATVVDGNAGDIVDPDPDNYTKKLHTITFSNPNK